MNIWTDKDGDCWFAEGHVSRAEMIEAVLEFERQAIGDKPEAASFAVKFFAEAPHILSYYYVVNDPDDSERYLFVDKEHDCAQPITMMGRL